MCRLIQILTRTVPVRSALALALTATVLGHVSMRPLGRVRAGRVSTVPGRTMPARTWLRALTLMGTASRRILAVPVSA
jgi:hypothetical protein